MPTTKKSAARAPRTPREHHVTYAITVDLPPQIGGRKPTQKALLELAAQHMRAAGWPVGAAGRVVVTVRDRRGVQRRDADARRRARQRKARLAAATPGRNSAAVRA